MPKIALLPGDGIGPEITKQAVKVLDKIAEKFEISIEYNEYPIGGNAIDLTGDPLPEDTLNGCKASDAVLLGAVGGPKWDTTDPNKKRPEDGLLGLRKGLELFANLRPVKANRHLVNASTLRPEVVSGIDMIIIRELTGGIYFGKKGRVDENVFDTCSYSKNEIDRIVKKSFEIAMGRRRILTSVDKANVLESSRCWRERTESIKEDFSEIKLNHMLVDNCAMQLIRNPAQFDVIVTENMFGDILSDEASMLTGSIGMLPSASLGQDNKGLYEPIHGSAPDIANQDKANPIGTIESIAMLLRYSLDNEEAAVSIENAVDDVLEKGYRTPDIMESGLTQVGTEEMGNLIVEAI
jgi:3-isopropylmalate dehydrogenase